jgi:hypothetical protein
MSVKSRTVLCRMTEDEFSRVKEKMSETGIRNISAYIRKMALDGYLVRIDLPEMQRLLSLLGHCSGNLNQYAKKANQTGCIYERDILELRQELDEIYDLMRKILEKLVKLTG